MGALRFPAGFSRVWVPHVLCSVNTNTRTHAVPIRDTSDPSVPSLTAELKGSFITGHLLILTGLQALVHISSEQCAQALSEGRHTTMLSPNVPQVHLQGSSHWLVTSAGLCRPVSILLRLSGDQDSVTHSLWGCLTHSAACRYL